MSIFDKVKEMFGATEEKVQGVPEQAKNAADDAGGKSSDMLGGMREKAEDAANSGIDKATDFAKEKSGGKFDDQIDQGSQMAKDNADKIDGQEG